MVEIDLRLVLDFDTGELSADSLIPRGLVARVMHAVDTSTLGEKLWEIATYHDCFVTRIRTADGTEYCNNFSYLNHKK